MSLPNISLTPVPPPWNVPMPNPPNIADSAKAAIAAAINFFIISYNKLERSI